MKLTLKTLKGEIFNIEAEPETTVYCKVIIDC